MFAAAVNDSSDFHAVAEFAVENSGIKKNLVVENGLGFEPLEAGIVAESKRAIVSWAGLA